MKGWVGLGGWLRKWDSLPAQRQSPIPVLTGLDVEQLRWSRPTRYRYTKPPTCLSPSRVLADYRTMDQSPPHSAAFATMFNAPPTLSNYTHQYEDKQICMIILQNAFTRFQTMFPVRQILARTAVGAESLSIRYCATVRSGLQENDVATEVSDCMLTTFSWKFCTFSLMT